MTKRNEIGLEGERECARQLELRGWDVVQLNNVHTNIPNVDLLISKQGRQCGIQVKSSRRPKGYITGGSVNPKVVSGAPIFNRVVGAPLCGYVILLASRDAAWRYFIMPAQSAEELFRKNINAYFGSPRLDGGVKSQSGQADIFVGDGTFPHARIVPDQRQEVLQFEDRWDLLEI